MVERELARSVGSNKGDLWDGVYRAASHPTAYRGNLYRSRLEATWAAFFDLCGWRFEYEPPELPGWAPDFLPFGNQMPVLCEVKPITRPHAETCARISDAANEARFRGHLLLLGVGVSVADGALGLGLGWGDDGWNPWFSEAPGPETEDNLDEFNFGEFAAAAYVVSPDGRLDFAHDMNAFCGHMTGAWDGDHYLNPDSGDAMAGKKWGIAKALTQWRPS